MAERVDPIWPTPNTAYFDGKPFTEFIQPTASGEPESGMFGCIRSGGRQFHEGLDLKPVSRDRAGEPKDPVFVVLPGVVRHISRIAGESNYGRYIVVEHTGVSPSVLTLYAHLSAIAPGLKIGDNVERGQTIGTMGRSSTGYAIPRDRAHLHFEMAVWLSRDFQSWYNWKKFGSRNDHGVWNGMNITGFDPLDFYNSLRSRAVDDFAQYFARMKPAVRVRIATKVIPDFIERYPALRQRDFPPPEQFAGWEVLFNDMALPFSWTPLTVTDLMGFKPNEVRAEPVDPAAKLPRCKSLVFKRRGRYEIGNDLEPTLQLLFGLRKAL
ncbi:M23 family peptidase [Opitutaceae bacterium EW11]|nr:M23 family peptidase [Opitutaceae bacterium EW11]